MTVPLHAVVLVAGLGSRLGPRSDRQPKCLTEVCGRTILGNALEALAAGGVAAATLVTGHLDQTIRDAVGTSAPLPVDYVHNARFAASGTAYSLLLALRHLSGAPRDLVVAEGDVYFEPALLRDFLACRPEPAMAVSPYDPRLDGTFVDVDAGGRVRSCIHQNARCADFDPRPLFKTVNLYHLPARLVRDVVVPALEAFVALAGARATLEAFLDRTLLAAAPLLAWTTNGHRWWEIDDERDLRTATEIFCGEAP